MTTILAFVAGYFVLLLLLSLLVRQKRERLGVLLNELLCMDLTPEQERGLNGMLYSAYSLRSAPATFLGMVVALLIPSAKFDQQAHAWAKKNPEMITDPRWSEVFDLYYVSIAAVNPIFGALMYGARLLFRLKAYLFVIRHYRPAGQRPAQPRTTNVDVRPKVTEMELFGEAKVAEAV